MKISLSIFFLSILFFYWSKSIAQSPNTKPPNIIFIIADDISWDDIGSYGNANIRTPNIDKMAKDGLRFTNVFLTTSSCSPSRISILTGRYPHNTGAAELHTPVPAHLAYFPEVLKNKGYYTSLAGKWHEGENSARAYDTLLVDKKMNGEGGEEQWINLLRSRPKNKPFFFWLATYDAHRAWSDNEDFEHSYKPEDVQVPLTLKDTYETRKDLASYYNEITRLDTYIGELINELQKQGIAENTLIVFTADNGRAFPGSKTRLYDRGIKTPFIAYWPKGIKSAGTVSDALISSIDISATFLDIAEAKIPESIQGKSFLQLFSKPETTFRNYIFAEHNWHDYEAYERAVRTKDFLYIVNCRPEYDSFGPIDANQSPSAASLKQYAESGDLSPLQKDAVLAPRAKEEFYNINKDQLQSVNIINAKENNKEINTLREILKQWQEETGDTCPEDLTPDWYHRETGKELPEKGQRGEMPGSLNNADRINKSGPF